jgi:uncharacterized protein
LQNALIIFIRNPQIGKVKTRLAKTIGIEKALTTYQLLLSHTREITTSLLYDKYLYYADFIAEVDEWSYQVYHKRVQKGDTLGNRMKQAFEELFAVHYYRVVIIGSDCYELTPAIIEQAFDLLHHTNIVIGPSKDGGYYLLGLSKFIPEIFDDIKWSTDAVMRDTLSIINKKQYSFKLLPLLNDIDEEKDLTPELRQKLKL